MRAFASEAMRFHDLRGRTPRSRFFAFCLVSATLFASICFCAWHFGPSDIRAELIVWVILPFYAVFIPSAMRRLHDAGESSHAFFEPLKPLAGLLLICWFWSQPMLFFIGFAVPEHPIAGLIGYLLVLPVLAVSFVFCVAAFIASLSHALSLFLLPSTTGPNQYGPNPNEVPS